ncbi:MAG: hypothetical protein HFF07_01605 [Oscillospiraceae bacterium]|jgi:hypothetical protein|nr:hypothetical protein [Oscillospiraceae bacterium]
METWGLVAFAVVFLLWDKIRRLERILRENDIRLSGAKDLGSQLRAKVGKTVTITLHEGGEGTTTGCRILDVDGEWLRVLRNEGKRNQREMLLRLADVKQIKG